MSASTTDSLGSPPPGFIHRFPLIAAVLIFIIGAIVRLTADYGYKQAGFDELLYRDYILMIDDFGFSQFPEVCDYYLADQRDPKNHAKLPPTRFLYILSGWTAKHLAFGKAPPVNITDTQGADRDPVLVSLHRVSLFFSILTVGLCGIAAWRMIGPGVGVGVMALVAFSPLGIHMGKHALVDGVFGFCATLCLWLLWENLQRANNARWLGAFAASLALLVIAKESAIFVYLAMCGIIVMNPWTKFGAVTRALLLAGVLGPLLGICVLVSLAGGIGPFTEIFSLFISKANTLEFVVVNGDGPWFRYLFELVMMEPIVMILALTGVFTLPRRSRAFGYLLSYFLITYVIMCNLRYGNNVRFTTIWALPLAAFAAAQVLLWCEHFRRNSPYVAAAVIALMSGYGWHQYQVYFVKHAIYEPMLTSTLHAINILKPGKQP